MEHLHPQATFGLRSVDQNTIDPHSTNLQGIALHTAPQATDALERLLHSFSSEHPHGHCIWRAEQDARQQGHRDPQRLSSSLNHIDVIPFYIPAIDELLPNGGLQRNAIHEIVYSDPLQPHALAHTVASVIAYSAWRSIHSSTKKNSWRSTINHSVHDDDDSAPLIVWIGARCWPTPLALSSYGTGDCAQFISRCLFVAPPSDSLTLWAIESALRSHAVQLVIAQCPTITRATTQRLALTARTHGTTAILLRSSSDRKLPSHAHSRWEVSPAPSASTSPSWNLRLHTLKGHSSRNLSWQLSLYAEESLRAQSPDEIHALRAQAISQYTRNTLEEATNQLNLLSASRR